MNQRLGKWVKINSCVHLQQLPYNIEVSILDCHIQRPVSNFILSQIENKKLENFNFIGWLHCTFHHFVRLTELWDGCGKDRSVDLQSFEGSECGWGFRLRWFGHVEQEWRWHLLQVAWDLSAWSGRDHIEELLHSECLVLCEDQISGKNDSWAWKKRTFKNKWWWTWWWCFGQSKC